MKINILSIPVLDQDKALNFYTDVLGFVINKNEDLGNGHRWITLRSEDQPDGPELLLEPGPLHFPPCKEYQDKLMEAKMPYTQFDVESLDAEYKRLVEKGVEFTGEPQTQGKAKFAIFNDTCGNLICLVEHL